MPTILRTESQVLVSVGDFTGYFDTKEGGEAEAGGEKRYRGGELKAVYVPSGRVTYSDLTVGRAVDDGYLDDLSAAEAMLSNAGDEPTSITVQLTNKRGEPVGAPEVFIGHIMKVTPPNADANSDTAATWSMTFAIVDKAV